MKGPRKGKQLEQLVATLERVLADKGVVIESPSRRLRDRDTGRPREHDVLLMWDHGHHQIVAAIECRDRSRPVGVPDIEAFVDKCDRTGVHSGVIVSSSGFTDSARKKAENRSITCMDLAEVERFDWMGIEVFVGFERRFESVHATLMFDGETPTEVSAIFDANGTRVTNDAITWTVINNVPAAEDPENEVDKMIPVRMQLNTLNWTVHDAQGRIWPVSHILANTRFTTIRTTHPVRTHSYAGAGKSYEVAIADARLGEHSGKFVMIKGEDGIRVSWEPEPSTKGSQRQD